ncbi:MAG: hypothetical protein ACLTSZ_02650 [Lachnospiraceae bacterium]
MYDSYGHGIDAVYEVIEARRKAEGVYVLGNDRFGREFFYVRGII